MEKFAFVILNYQCLDETVHCIKSILNLKYEEKYIVVVDNASDNQEEVFSCLRTSFTNERIIFLKSSKNLGYARGNNIGIDYARKKLNADFVCILNPDIIIQSADFIEKSIALYYSHGYALLGPKIMELGHDTNPLFGYTESAAQWLYRILDNYRIYYTKKWKLFRLNPFKKRKLEQTGDSMEQSIPALSEKPETYWMKKDGNIILVGACLIFSPTFFDKFTGFCKDTFLYFEEALLAFVCFQFGYGMLFSSEILAEHGDSKSLKAAKPDADSRMLFVLSERARSCKSVLKTVLHRKNKNYLQKCLNPIVDDYCQV